MTGVSTFSSSQAGRQAGDSTTSQKASAIVPNSSLVASQAGRQAGSYLPGDSATSQTVSTVPLNSPPSWENISQEGSSLVSSQAGRQAGSFSSSQAGRGQCFFPRSQYSPF